jgi:leucyl-tRNA synthetase
MQTNWIGRSEGAEIDFAVEADGVAPIRVFTTRPDTIFGATFMVLAPEHSAVAALTAEERRAEVEAYVAAARRETEIERMGTERDRSGVFIGGHAINPMTEERIPIWIADYVLPGYGTGAVMGVPAHDDRDYAFAKRYELPVRYVITPRGGEVPTDGAFLPHTQDEVLVDSGTFTGMAAADAIAAITDELAQRGQGAAAISYRLRDWLISRQRYWGPPIPIVYCPDHGAQPLPEDQLPVLLPLDVDFAPTGVSPLESHAAFLAASCPVCAGPARRETDTLDTFVDSSWYFLRYTSPHEEAQAWDPVAVMRWLPVDLYTGGAEHAVLHLMYARFFVKALRDMHLLDFDEPFTALRNQGQILGADHHRMSKSRGNVVNPDDLTSRFGSDTVRCFLMFIGPWDQGGPWNPSSIEGVHRFLGRVWSIAQATGGGHPRQIPGLPADTPGGFPPSSGDVPSQEMATIEGGVRALRQTAHRTIKEVGEDYAEFHFNTALSKMMELTNALGSARDDGLAGTEAYAEAVEALLLLMAPMAPHISEELWARRGKPYSIHQQAWPAFDPALVAADIIELPVQVDGKLRDRLSVAPDTAAEEIERLALASERVQAYLKGRAPRKVVQIPGRLVNIVTPADE